MVIEVTYNVTDVYMSTTVSPIYITVDYSGSGGSGASVWGSITGTLSNQTDLQTALDDKVPYTGATEDVNLGEWEMKAGQFTLDTSPTGTAAVGTTQWNDTIGSSQTTLKGGSVVLKNGVDLVARIVNKVSPNTTLTKAAYQAVRVSGAQGQRLAVAFAQANNDNNSADTIGLVIETIATNQEGFIMTVGQIEGINTTGSLQGETWADGDVLYLSPTVAGALTNVKPTGATGHIVIIGYVEYAHSNNGKIYVKVMNGWELDELHNVYISSVANNQGLFYESSSDLWKNKSISTVLGYIPEQPLTFSSPLSRSTNTVSIPAASSSSNGYLSSTDWSTFNGKQNALTNPVTGTGTSNELAYFSGTSAISSLTTATYPSLTELSYVKGVTSAVQTQLNAKQGTITLTTTGTSGAATLVGNTLNIPQYSGGGGMAIGGSITSATAGSVLFAGTSGVLAQDNSNLFWDDTNNRLGLGTNTPTYHLHLYSTSLNSPFVLIETNAAASGSNYANGIIFSRTLGGATNNIGIFTDPSKGHTTNADALTFALALSPYTRLLVIQQNGGISAGTYAGNNIAPANGFMISGNVLIGTTTDSGFKLDVNGTARIQGNLTTNLTLGSVPFVGSSGLLSQDNSNLFWDNTNKRLGIGTTSPTFALEVKKTTTDAWIMASRGANNVHAGLLLNPNGAWSNTNLLWNFALYQGTNDLRYWGWNGSSDKIMMSIFGATSNVVIAGGTSTVTDAGYRLDVNGTMRVQDNLTVNKNQNGTTKIESINTTDGTVSETFFNAISDASSGQIRFGKYASSHVTYKTLVAKDAFVYNSSTGGNISILNDFASGNINFASGGSSTAHMTIKSNGRINMSSLPTSATGLSTGDLWNDAGTLKIV